MGSKTPATRALPPPCIALCGVARPPGPPKAYGTSLTSKREWRPSLPAWTGTMVRRAHWRRRAPPRLAGQARPSRTGSHTCKVGNQQWFCGLVYCLLEGIFAKTTASTARNHTMTRIHFYMHTQADHLLRERVKVQRVAPRAGVVGVVQVDVRRKVYAPRRHLAHAVLKRRHGGVA